MDRLIRDFISEASDYDGGLTRAGQEIAQCLLSAACDRDLVRRREVLFDLGHKLGGILDFSDAASDDDRLQSSADELGVVELGSEWVECADDLNWQVVTDNYDSKQWSPGRLLGFAASMSGSIMTILCIYDDLRNLDDACGAIRGIFEDLEPVWTRWVDDVRDNIAYREPSAGLV